MAAYSKDFLIDAFMSRYLKCELITIDQLVHMEENAIALYDRVGRDAFRTYASLDAEAIRTFKASLA